MNALKLRELLLLLLSSSVSAAPREGQTAPEQDSCNEQATQNTIYVGMHIATDRSFRECTLYKGDILRDYLSAFVGAVDMQFWETKSPPVKVVFLGSSELEEHDEDKIIGLNKDASSMTLRGGDALGKLMDLTAASDTYIATNKIFYVMTWLNITEETTKKEVNENMANPGDMSDSSSSESSEEDIVLSVRSSSKKKEPENVPGVTNYGSFCSVWGAGAIGRDDGRYFSGVSTAALQVATALGQMYNGSIARRTCDEYYVESSSEFHKTQCYAAATKQEEDFDCLKEAVVEEENTVKTPSDFFLKHNEWTPCKVSYIGSHKCDKISKEECKIECCSSVPNLSLNPISAPDGSTCNTNQVCVSGACTSRNVVNS